VRFFVSEVLLQFSQWFATASHISAQMGHDTALGLSTADLILAWERYGLTPTILFIKSKSTCEKSTEFTLTAKTL